MKKLHTFGLWDRPQAVLLKEIFAGEGIDCLVRNADLAVAVGEIPITECFPELWVIDNEAFPRARLLMDGWLKNDSAEAAPWSCPGCGEVLDGNFGACWSCGRCRD
jgi:hypothetical protein